MKMRNSLLIIFLNISIVTVSFTQITFYRSGIFLHHSTGGCIWGPNGSSTSVPQEIISYNSTHGYTGNYAVSLDEDGWPVNPWNNEWVRWHWIFENRDTVNADIRPYLQTNKIIIIKSCFPSSAIVGIGSATDTLNPTLKTIFNYKWHWRHFIRVMENYPQNFFIVWTNAPLVQASTNAQSAAWSHKFCTWAIDTLARGLDSQFGNFPANVYVFDFFHKLANSNGYLSAIYAQSSTNSHPNSAATELVAPIFVQEVFDASIRYEQSLIPQDTIPPSVPTGLTVSPGGQDSLIISWNPNPEPDMAFYKIYRSINDTTNLDSLDLVAHPSTIYVDNNNIQPGNLYAYALLAMDSAGNQSNFSDTVIIEIPNPTNLKKSLINNISNSFKLSRNYPNPFNPITYFNFFIPVSDQVTISIYNISGQIIESETWKLSPGLYTYKFQGNSLSSGIYIYQISTTSGFKKARKMLLQR